MVQKNYAIDLQLPVISNLPPSEQADEFRQLYAAYRALQDGISEGSGAFSIAPADLVGAELLDQTGIQRQGVLIAKAYTAIALGQACEVVAVDGDLWVKQPATVSTPAIYDFDIPLQITNQKSACFPLTAAAIGEKLGVVLHGQSAIAPLAGATVGQKFYMNASGATVAYTGDIQHYFSYNLGFLGTYLYYMRLGICVVPDEILAMPLSYISYQGL